MNDRVQCFGDVDLHLRALKRLNVDIQRLTDKELKDILVNEAVRRNLSGKWFKQSEKDTKTMVKRTREERQKKREEVQRVQDFQKTPLYKFRLLAQLVDKQKRIDGLSQWSPKDLRTVLKEVATMTTMAGIPAYRFRESKEDLNAVISQKVNLESS